MSIGYKLLLADLGHNGLHLHGAHILPLPPECVSSPVLEVHPAKLVLDQDVTGSEICTLYIFLITSNRLSDAHLKYISPCLNTSFMIFLLVLLLSEYPWKSLTGWPLSIRPISSPASPGSHSTARPSAPLIGSPDKHFHSFILKNPFSSYLWPHLF